MVALVVLLVAGCARGGRVPSLVLSGGVSDFPGGGAPTCPWPVVEEVEIQEDTVYVDGRPYPVDSDAGANAFQAALTLCGRDLAREAFVRWRQAVADAPMEEPPTGKIALAPSTSEVDFIPMHERQPEHAWVEGYAPAGGAPRLEPLPSSDLDEVTAARDAFLQAMRGD